MVQHADGKKKKKAKQKAASGPDIPVMVLVLLSWWGGYEAARQTQNTEHTHTQKKTYTSLIWAIRILSSAFPVSSSLCALVSYTTHRGALNYLTTSFSEGSSSPGASTSRCDCLSFHDLSLACPPPPPLLLSVGNVRVIPGCKSNTRLVITGSRVLWI